MKDLSKARFDVIETEHLWIEMPDGVRLAARLWMPDCDAPVPALLEYIPYRKVDMVRARDERNHPFFAAHGYACLRVDMRGSGDSDGVMPDMYDPQELADARDVIDWIAAQPWCSGRVGMFGTSWGGTAGLQASVDAPAALKAVIAVCATHDRYEDDIHHMGGCLLTDTLEWGATLPAILASPPSPAVGPDWLDRWRTRLDRLAFPVEHWVRHEARGTYWRHGSVTHQTDRISVPVLGVGGWSDRYSNSVTSLVQARPDLVWGVVGPWGHHYPDHGHPGPAIGFQALAMEWWDHWLQSESPAAPDWPRLRVWRGSHDAPQDAPDMSSGDWIETGPPADETAPYRLVLSEAGLAASDGTAPVGAWDVPHDLTVGRMAGDTGYFGRFGGQPPDQRVDDARSLVFDTAPLAEDVTLLGSIVARLTLHSAARRAQVAVRIEDVAPDGTSARIGLALRNLALNDALDDPGAAPVSGVRIAFPTRAYRFRAGHRIRLAVSSGYWPMIWPAPGRDAITLQDGVLDLPCMTGAVRPLRADLPAAVDLPAEKSFDVVAAPPLRRIAQDTDGAEITGWHQPFSAVRYHATETTFGFETSARHSIRPDDPLSARSVIEHRMVFERPDGTAQITCCLTARCDAAQYHLDATLIATWNGTEIARQTWAVSPERYLS